MRKLLMMMLSLFLAFSGTGQSLQGKSGRGYVYLNDGTVLKGRYSYAPALDRLMVESEGVSRIFNISQINRVSKLNSVESGTPAPSNKSQLSGKFLSLTEAGILAGNPDNQRSAPLITGTSFNHAIRDRLYAGVGAGVEFFSETYLPVTGNVIYLLRNRNFSPFVMLQTGYQIPLEGARTHYYGVVPYNVRSSSIWPGPMPIGESPLEAIGGLLVNPSIGIMQINYGGLGYSLALGYRFHRLRYEGDEEYRLEIDYHRMSVKLGVVIF